MAPNPAAEGGKKSRKKVSDKVLTQFTSNLAILQDAGLPIVRSLRILEGQTKPGPFKSVLKGVWEDVEGGNSLSEAMSKHPGCFDSLYTNMVKAGEAGGILDTILQRLAEFKEKAQRLKGKVLGAMIYPIVVTVVATGLLLFIMIYVVPKFEEVYAQLGSRNNAMELPGLTKVLMGFSRWLLPTEDGGWGIVILPVVLIVLWVTLSAIARTHGGSRFLDRMKLKIPVLGDVTKKSIIAQFSRTLGTLLSSGVPILESLNIVKGSISNTVLQDSIQVVHDSIKEGENMADPLGKSGIFDDMVVNMIDVGEETGELDKMLIKIADTYDEQVDVKLAAFVSMLEPLLIVLMGVAVGVIVIGTFLPMLQMWQSMEM